MPGFRPLMPEEIEALWTKVQKIRIQLSANPREEGPGYISLKIQEIRAAASLLNDLGVPIQRNLHEATAKVRSLKDLREELISVLTVKNGAAAATAAERKAWAQVMANQQYYRDNLTTLYRSRTGDTTTPTDEVLKEFTKTLLPDEVPKTLNEDLQFWQTHKENMSALSKTLENKRREIKEHDAAVRLQHHTIDTELKAFGIRGNPLNLPPLIENRDSDIHTVQVPSYFDEVVADDGEILLNDEEFNRLTEG